MVYMDTCLPNGKRRHSVANMSTAQTLRIYLDDIPRRRAEKGNFNLINLIRSAFEKKGYQVELCQNSSQARLKSADDPGYSLFHMDDPFHPRALTLRRAYYYPFWRIEKSAKRWKWDIARETFQPEDIDAATAKQFCQYWRKRLFDLDEPSTRRDELVYIPLQGRLLERRSFQSLSPIEMIEAVLKHDPDRHIWVSFHPAETYIQSELNAVQSLADKTPRLSIRTEPMEAILARCAYVATENSSVALAGYFFHKPAVLFAKIDFHHIAVNADEIGNRKAIRAAADLHPDYDRYLFWFLKLTAINGGAPDAEARILDAVRRNGWSV